MDLSGIESAINSGISVSTDIGFSTFEPLAVLAICIVGSVIGWKKVLPGLAVFVIYALATNNESVDTSNFINLIAVILLWCGAGALFKKVRSKLKRQKTKSEPVSVDEDFQPVSSVQRALAKTR
jgi:thiol:disulfide interchange protein